MARIKITLLLLSYYLLSKPFNWWTYRVRSTVYWATRNCLFWFFINFTESFFACFLSLCIHSTRFQVWTNFFFVSWVLQIAHFSLNFHSNYSVVSFSLFAFAHLFRLFIFLFGFWWKRDLLFTLLCHCNLTLTCLTLYTKNGLSNLFVVDVIAQKKGPPNEIFENDGAKVN